MVRIACCQTTPIVADVAANDAVAADQIRQGVTAGADVIVLPELMTSGYMFTDAHEARSVALPTVEASFASWISAAGDSLVIGGYCELGADGELYNSAVMVDSDGIVAHYRKTHLWDREKLIFTPGATLPAVTKTRHGAIAVMICFDVEFPEVTRHVALRGAELIAAPVNWPLFRRPTGEHPGEVISAMAAARTNKIAVACCDRTGVERDQPWIEGSVIIDPDGWVVATAGSGNGIAIADIDLSITHDKALTAHVDLFGDRRTDLY